MQKLGLNELRERYLGFFESKGHLRLPSFPLVPQNDTSILLINAGMTPLKRYFTGEEEPPGKRIATCQKCLRTPDIENVGKTARHGTYFEMLGNFSFGDYFKKEAILWAWEFITEDLKLPEDKLYPSIYLEDEEAFDIWNKDVGISAERIIRLGKKDNFWEHGTGPCGPCSEIYFDRGADKGCGKPDCAVGCDCDRYVEFWNLVFTQFSRDESGNYTKLEKKNIDTGMGLERIACIMQEVNNLFEVDTVRNVLNHICKVAGVEYGKSNKADVSIRIVTDHIRSTTMMICDGILPSNEGRGYVLRRLLRRAARYGKLLGIDKPFLFDAAKVVINESKEAYPELEEKSEYIQKVIKIEEERFDATIDQGLIILNGLIDSAKVKNEKVIQGGAVFKLHDTYGFPLDLTREIAEENGLSVDEAGFKKEMDGQRKKAREALKNKGNSAWDENIFSKLDKRLKTEFLGYSNMKAQSRIMYIVKDDEVVENAQEGDEVAVILDKTPFYAESGGQVGDTGLLDAGEGIVKINDCKKTIDGKYLHIGVVEKGIIEKGIYVQASIDSKRRMSISRNHTVTHLLQKALRDVLGSHVSQSGSLVEPERLRFDFAHFSPVSPDEIAKIEKEVNEKIMADIAVDVREMGIGEAKKLGATALFGEKYGDIVRVVRIDGYSMELCGGTHINATSRAGLVKITGENGIAAGVRRIEALTGEAAIEYMNEKERLLNGIAAALKASPQDSVKKVDVLNINLRNAEKEIEQLQNKLVNMEINNIQKNLLSGIDSQVITLRFDEFDVRGLLTASDTIKNKIGSGVVVLATSYNGEPSFTVAVTADIPDKGIDSRDIIKDITKIAGGGGGGRPLMAQAKGRDVSKINEALEYIKKTYGDLIKNRV